MRTFLGSKKMGFISFNENYFSERLETLESKPLTDADIYETKQLLKILEDLADEGYSVLNQHLEKNFSCLTRLRTLLRSANTSPFAIKHDSIQKTSYGDTEYELETLLGKLISEAQNHCCPLFHQTLLTEIRQYSHWIGYNHHTAYVFLLRDTLLPYVYFKSRSYHNCYPWLISRKFLDAITYTKNTDDDIRSPVYEALEVGKTEFTDFSSYCKNKILAVLDQHTKLKTILLDLLKSIKEDTIIVVESGYIGTIPMMLKALDNRVRFRLYTTAPFLYHTYQNLIYCRKYEDIRNFETLYSQNYLFQYSSFHHGKFYVKLSDNSDVQKRSLDEINRMLP